MNFKSISFLKLHKKPRGQTDPVVLVTYLFGLGLSHGLAEGDVALQGQ